MRVQSEANCPDTDDGVLGGFGQLSFPDVRDSNKFLDELVTKIGLQFGTATGASACVVPCDAGVMLNR